MDLNGPFLSCAHDFAKLCCIRFVCLAMGQTGDHQSHRIWVHRLVDLVLPAWAADIGFSASHWTHSKHYYLHAESHNTLRLFRVTCTNTNRLTRSVVQQIILFSAQNEAKVMRPQCLLTTDLANNFVSGSLFQSSLSLTSHHAHWTWVVHGFYMGFTWFHRVSRSRRSPLDHRSNCGNRHVAIPPSPGRRGIHRPCQRVGTPKPAGHVPQHRRALRCHPERPGKLMKYKMI